MAEHIKTLVCEYIKKNKQKKDQCQKIIEILKKEIGKEIGENIKVEIKDNKELIFLFGSSTAIYNFKLQESKINKAIKKEFSQIKKIKAELSK